MKGFVRAADKAHKPPQAALRPPQFVMHLPRMGAFHQTRLSFMRSMLRDAADAGARFSRKLWDINKDGEGVAVYVLRIGGRAYSLVVYAHNLPPEKRSDRVIAEEWDATFTLVKGEVNAKTAAAMHQQVSKQEAGRQNDNQLVLSRANRSVRLFEYVVDSLARGRQPSQSRLNDVGYLMRTTAVYANGKFGLCAHRNDGFPFRAEMTAVWMFRVFVADLAGFMAKMRAPHKAVMLNTKNRKLLGIGNATGLGMAPFLINHPLLLHKWILARETALARVRAAEYANKKNEEKRERFLAAAAAAISHITKWQTIDKIQSKKIIRLNDDINAVIARANKTHYRERFLWDMLYRWGEANLSLEGLEMLVSLLLEPFGELTDDLAATMSAPEAKTRIKGAMTTKAMRKLLQQKYDWAIAHNFAEEGENARFWYVSADKMEPRLGECQSEKGENKQLPLVIARQMQSFHNALADKDNRAYQTLADFLHAHPHHRHSARRACFAAMHPYGEIRANLASKSLLPLDMLRCKLSFFGATRFDPRSDRWLRITMYQNAPHPDEECGDDNWIWQ